MQVTEMGMTKSMVEFEIKGKKYIVMKSSLRTALKEVERWQISGGSNFTIKLIELIAKADNENKERILKGFPEVVCAYLLWFYKIAFGQLFESDEKFFEEMYRLLGD